MGINEVSANQIHAFRRFLKVLPHGKDQDLVLLKAHLLIEEQVRRIVDERLKNPAALVDTRIDCHQAICLAQSLFLVDFQPWLWAALKKLNRIRNDIAHNLEPKGLNDKIKDFVASFPSGFADMPVDTVSFELTLWAVFIAVSDLVETPSAQLIELIPKKEP
jgi:hypothetical protein